MAFTPEIAARIRALFDQAIELPPEPAESLLAAETSPEVAAEVRRLVRAERAAASFLTPQPETDVLDAGAGSLLPPPPAVGPYRLLERLGEGGMGLVFRARKGADPPVAIKIVRQQDAATRQGLRREIHALSHLRHPGIVRIVDSGSDEGIVWYAMELLSGTTLRDELRRARDREGRVDAAGRRRLLGFLRAVCGPLGYLHGEGLVHRDLKPENVMLTGRGSPVIVDFGLAVAFHAGNVSRERLEVGATVSGTVAYMSPEQALGRLPDARADLYALGCMLHEALTGRPPFVGRAGEVLLQHIDAAPAPPSAVSPGIPPELDALVAALLEKAPRARLGYAADVAARLAPFADEVAADPSPPARPYLYRPALVGRARELSSLEGAMKRLAGGCGGMVIVTGESGVGKTRLVMDAAMAATVQGVEVLAGECGDGAGPDRANVLAGLRRPLLSIVDHCRDGGARETARTFGDRGPVLAVVEPSIGALPGQETEPAPAELPPREGQLRLLTCLAATFEALAASRPRLLIVDDLQWADDLTLGFLALLARGGALERSRLLVLATCRAESAASLQELLTIEGVERLDLGRLPQESVAEMTEEMLATGTPPPFSAFLARQSEGNPFFVAEYLRSAMAAGILRREHGNWRLAEARGEGGIESLELPGSIRELVAGHVGSVTTAARELLLVASALGREAPEPLLAATATLGEEDFLQAGHELVAASLLEAGREGLRFVHDKVREVAYGLLADDARRRVHRRAADTIETLFPAYRDGEPAKVAHHWREAGEPARARGHYLIAARRAEERFAPAEAARLYREYVALVEEATVDSVRARVSLGKAEYTQGRNDEAIRTLDDAIREAEQIGAVEEALRARFATVQVLLRVGRIVEARAIWDAGRSRSEELGLRGVEIEFQCQGAHVHVAAGNLDEALRWARRAVAEALAAGDRRTEILARGALATTHTARGEPAEAAAAYTAALEGARATGWRAREATLLGNLGVLHRTQGRHAEAMTCLEDSLGIARERGDMTAEMHALSNMAALQHRLGRNDRALSLLQEALRISRAIGDVCGEAVLLVNAGSLESEAGRRDEARSALERGLAIAHAGGHRQPEIYARQELGQLCADEGDWEGARRSYEEGLAIARGFGSRPLQGLFLMSLATLERRSGGDLRRASDLAVEAGRFLADSPEDAALCLVERGHVALASGTDPGAHLREAEAVAAVFGEKLPAPLAAALAGLRRAVAAAIAGQPLLHGEAPATGAAPPVED